MQCFVSEIKPVQFIGACGDGPTPPPGQVAWDDNTPWDNTTYWA